MNSNETTPLPLNETQITQLQFFDVVGCKYVFYPGHRADLVSLDVQLTLSTRERVFTSSVRKV